MMSFVNPTVESKSAIDIPDAFEAKVIHVAKSYGLITEKEAVALMETQAIQQCVDAFVANGYEPSAAVDKLAEITVEQGYFKNKEAAKRVLKNYAEKARKTESLWTKLYDYLGL